MLPLSWVHCRVDAAQRRRWRLQACQPHRSTLAAGKIDEPTGIKFDVYRCGER
jgi:hypothetical protein